VAAAQGFAAVAERTRGGVDDARRASDEVATVASALRTLVGTVDTQHGG
jgi:hypothetical protein